jgi:hypothetical protein
MFKSNSSHLKHQLQRRRRVHVSIVAQDLGDRFEKLWPLLLCKHTDQSREQARQDHLETALETNQK